jgi:hypothetical protein
LDPWEYKSFLLKRVFPYAQIPFEAGFIVCGLLLMKRTEFTGITDFMFPVVSVGVYACILQLEFASRLTSGNKMVNIGRNCCVDTRL